MAVVERQRGDRRRLARLIAKESDAMQRDRLRSVLLVLQGRQALEVPKVVGRSRRFVQRWAYTCRDGRRRGRGGNGRSAAINPCPGVGPQRIFPCSSPAHVPLVVATRGAAIENVHYESIAVPRGGDPDREPLG